MKEINFLGLGFELGQEHRGLRHSHEYVRQYFSFLKKGGLDIVDHGDVSSQSPSRTKLYDAAQVGRIDWTPYRNAYNRIQELLQRPEALLNWGGDHSVAIATVGAFCARHPQGYVVWIDAHADINLPEHSLSGNLHGMPLSILLDIQGVRSKHFPWIENSLAPEKLIYVGVRDLDPFEKEIIKKLNIKAYTAEDVRRRGIKSISQEIYKTVAGSPLHVSFDIDSLSPEFAPSTGVRAAEGLGIEDVKALGETLARHRSLCSVDVVEINPSIGNTNDVFQTYMAALVFLMSIFQSVTEEGEIYDGFGRSVQNVHATPLESRP